MYSLGPVVGVAGGDHPARDTLSRRPRRGLCATGTVSAGCTVARVVMEDPGCLVPRASDFGLSVMPQIAAIFEAHDVKTHDFRCRCGQTLKVWAGVAIPGEFPLVLCDPL